MGGRLQKRLKSEKTTISSIKETARRIIIFLTNMQKEIKRHLRVRTTKLSLAIKTLVSSSAEMWNK